MKNLFKILFTLFILLLFFADIYAQPEPIMPQGDGTEANPYRISSLENLYWISAEGTLNGVTYSQRNSSHYVQTNDIDAYETKYWNDSQGWVPIGIQSTNIELFTRIEDLVDTFTGSYDGNGNTISNLYINRKFVSYYGFFSVIDEGAEVTNLGLENVEIKTAELIDVQVSTRRSNQIGGLAGVNRGLIENCYVTGNVDGNTSVGGLVGANYGGTISNCYAIVNVNLSISEYDYDCFAIGGLVGRATGSNEHGVVSVIRQSYSKGIVRGNRVVGGLIGMHDGSMIVENSYTQATLILEGEIYEIFNDQLSAGGFVGYSTNQNIEASYSAGRIIFLKDPTEWVGGFSGVYYNQPNPANNENSYWDVEVSNFETSFFGQARSTQEMMTRANYEGWDFNNVWVIDENSSYPYFGWQEGEIFVQPAITIEEAKDVTFHSASISAQVINIDDIEYESIGFCWDTLPNVRVSNNSSEVSVNDNLGNIETILSNLQQNRNYFVRAYVIQDGFASYSREVMLTTKSIEESIDDFPDIFGLINPQIPYANIDDVIEAEIFLTFDSVNVFLEPMGATLVYLGDDEISVYKDINRTNQLRIGDLIELNDNITNIYITSSSQVIDFDISSVFEVEQDDYDIVKDIISSMPISFIEREQDSVDQENDGIESVFITHRDMDITSRFELDTLLESGAELSLYALGIDYSGNIVNISDGIWRGLDDFSYIEETGNRIIFKAESGVGRFVFEFNHNGIIISDTTAYIYVEESIDRVFVINNIHWTGSLDDTTFSLGNRDTVYAKLGEEIDFSLLGYNSDNNTIVKSKGIWQINNGEPSSLSSELNLLFQIDSINEVGFYEITAYHESTDSQISFTLKVTDFVDEITVETLANFLGHERYFFSDSPYDTLYILSDILNENNRVIKMNSFYQTDSINVPIAVSWQIRGENGFDVIKTPNFSNTIAPKFPRGNIFIVNVKRGDVEVSFVVKTINEIARGIAPNPVLASQFKNENSIPTVSTLVFGDIKDIYIQIFDSRGNLVNTLSGLDNAGGDFEINHLNIDGSKSNESNAEKSILLISSNKWNGKNRKGNYLNTGVYILYYHVYFKTNNIKYTKSFNVDFYYINNVQSF